MINNNIFLLILLSIVSIILIKIIYKWYIRTNNIVNKQNIVILGLSRTGTSSMCEALRILGNEVWHFTYLKPKTMRKFGYNAIGDLPNFRRNFMASDIEPNTKYILTTRSSILWERSMKKWINEIWNIDIDKPYTKPCFINKYYKFGDNIFKKSPINFLNRYIHNVAHEYPEIYKDNFKDIVKNHEERIISLFNNSGNMDKLLVIDITDKSVSSSKKWEELCKFLDVKKNPEQCFPNESYEDIYLNQIKRYI